MKLLVTPISSVFSMVMFPTLLVKDFMLIRFDWGSILQAMISCSYSTRDRSHRGGSHPAPWNPGWGYREGGGGRGKG